MVRAAITDLERTVVVVSSKSGSTVETDSQRRAFAGRLLRGRHRPHRPHRHRHRPGQPARRGVPRRRLPRHQRRPRRRRPLLRPDRLRAGALAASPAPTSRRCSTTPRRSPTCSRADDDANPALRLGAAMAGTDPLRDKLVIVDDGSGIVGFADWAEQLIAESHRQAAAPASCPSSSAATPTPRSRWPAADVTVVRLVGDSDDDVEVDASARPRRPGRRQPLRGRRQRPARRPAAALGGRHRRGRAAARHQPVRPARRRERQEGGPRAAGQGHRRCRGTRRHRRRGRDPRPGRRLARRRQHRRRRRSTRCSPSSTPRAATSP